MIQPELSKKNPMGPTKVKRPRKKKVHVTKKCSKKLPKFCHEVFKTEDNNTYVNPFGLQVNVDESLTLNDMTRSSWGTHLSEGSWNGYIRNYAGDGIFRPDNIEKLDMLGPALRLHRNRNLL